MSTQITLHFKEKSSPLCAWRNIIEHLSEKERQICARSCHALRIMVLHDPAADLEKMRERRALWAIPPKPLPQSIGLSELFLNSLKKPLPYALDEPIKKDPDVIKTVSGIFARERAFPQKIPVYHAMNMEIFIFTLFTGVVHSCIAHSSPVTSFIRLPSPKGPKTIEEMFQLHPPKKYKTAYDHRKDVAKELLSCNPHLFANSNVGTIDEPDYSESTLSYYLSGDNVSPPPIKKLFQEFSLQYHLSLDDTELDQLIKLHRDLFQLASHSEYLNLKQKTENPKGVIWQFLIPPAVLDRVAYPSQPFGEEYPSPTGLSLSQRCSALRQNPFKEEDLQVRLLAQAMFVPEHDIQVFVHGCDFFSQEQLVKPKNMSDEDWDIQNQYLRQKNEILFSVKDFFKKKLLAIPQKK